MAGPSGSRLRAGLGIVGAIGLLLLAGRLWQPGPDRLAPPSGLPPWDGGEPFGPSRPLPSGVEFGQPISGLAVTPAAVWVAYGTTIARLDPHSLRATASLQVTTVVHDIPAGTARPIRGLAAGGDAIWASLPSPSAGLLRIDPASARIVAVIRIPSIAPAAVSGARVWVVCCGGETYLGASQLVLVDAAANRLTARIGLPGLPDAVGVGRSGVWVRAAAGPIWRVDPLTTRVAATLRVPHGLGGGQGSVLVGDDAVWVADPATATILRIDPRSNQIVERRSVTGRALAATADGTVLVASGGRLLGLGRGQVRSVRVDRLDGAYTTALATGAGTIWVAQAGMLLHVDQRELR
jgi:streptogramin lyase